MGYVLNLQATEGVADQAADGPGSLISTASVGIVCAGSTLSTSACATTSTLSLAACL